MTAGKKYGMLVDLDLCIGCKACEVACRQEHNLKPRVGEELDFKKYGAPFWVKVNWAGPYGTFPTLSFYYYAEMCAQCDDPPCAAACEPQFFYKRDDGIVGVDRTKKCDGCGECVRACPYPGVIWIDPETKLAEKCSFCYHRLEDGREPACVKHCPMQCLTFGDMNDPTSTISTKLRTKDVQNNRIKIPVPPHMEVLPNVTYVLRRKQAGHFG